VPYAVNVFATQPAEVAMHADAWLDNPTPDIDGMMKQWLADADMSWAYGLSSRLNLFISFNFIFSISISFVLPACRPTSDEGQFSRTPAHSLSRPRKPLGDLSNKIYRSNR
jgi:hypothetical protein